MQPNISKFAPGQFIRIKATELFPEEYGKVTRVNEYNELCYDLYEGDDVWYECKISIERWHDLIEILDIDEIQFLLLYG